MAIFIKQPSEICVVGDENVPVWYLSDYMGFCLAIMLFFFLL